MTKTDERRPRAKKSTVVKEAEATDPEILANDTAAVAMPTDELGNEAQSTGQDSEVLELPVLPLRGTVVFPLTVVPLAAAQARSLRLIDEVMSGDRIVALVMQKDAEIEGAGPDDVYGVGTISTIHQMMRVPDGTVRLAVQGNERMRILEFVGEEPYLDGPRRASPRKRRRIGRGRGADAKHARTLPTTRLARRAHAG